MATVAEQIQKVYIGLLGRAADKAGLDYWTNEIESGALTLEQLRANIVEEQPEYAAGLGQMTRAQAVNQLYQNLFNRQAESEGLDYWVNGDGSSVSFDQLVLALIDGAQAADTLALDNKTEVAQYYTAQADADYSESAARSAIDDVDGSTSLANAKSAVDAALSGEGGDLSLTQRADDLTGTAADDVFEAPVTQNETGSGALANTFETGDVLDGGEGQDVLRADLISSGSISNNWAPAISADTTSVEEVHLRAQAFNVDAGANNPISGGFNFGGAGGVVQFTGTGATVDAEKMSGVEEWWSDNSRANMVIEDVRSATEDTTFGMRETDPNVNFGAFFNSLFLEGGTDVGASAFNFTIQEANALGDELQDITVNGIRFELDGESYELGGADVEAANTWADLQTALQAEIDATAGLEDLTVVHQGNGQFVVTDPASGDFVIDPAGTVISSSTTNEVKDASLGQPVITDLPTETDVVLDGAGGGSVGGMLNIGAMSGNRGVEVFNTVVDRDSHLALVQSTNGQAAGDGTPNEYLQVLNLENTGANGDLQLGTRTNNLDNRAALSVAGDGDGLVTGSANDTQSGLFNVREVNAGEFQGNLNIAIALDNNAIGRYLDPATEEVEFNYTAGAGDDLFNIADLSTMGVSGDQDFAMNVDMGAGDDRLVINVPNVSSTTVDGGEGENSIVVSQSHGTNAANTFESFADFQTYEVEGNGSGTFDNTQHDFTSMPGVENVVVATDDGGAVGDNTQLINMEADQSVTVSGKNQTLGNNSTADQDFGTVQLTNDQGADRTVTLDNTARLANSTSGVRQDGVLSVNNLTVDSNANLSGTASAVRNLTIDSSGERSTANAIAQLNAAAVNSLNLEGTQDLSLDVNNLATAPGTNQAPLDIDASTLEGDLALGLNGALLNQITGNGTDTIEGTTGDNDVLMVHAALTAGNEATVTGFETIQLGSVGTDAGVNDTMFGDLAIARTVQGTFDAANVVGSDFAIADVVNGQNLTLDNLGNGATVSLGDANRDANGAVVNNQTLDEAITLDSGATAGTPASELDVNLLSVLATNQTHDLTVNGYQTINLDVAHAANSLATGDVRNVDLTVDADARVLNVSGGDQDGVNTAGQYDALTFVNTDLPNSLTQVNLTDYVGEVTLIMQADVAGVANETDVEFTMSEYNADVTLSDDTTNATDFTNGANLSEIEHNSIFEFTGDRGDTADVSTWSITNFVADFDGLVNDSETTIDNLTRLDLTDLGITQFNQVDISWDGTNTLIRSEDQVNDGNVTWQVEIMGIDLSQQGEISADNFIF